MKDILEKTFKGKKVLITGHTGFKGSWLSIWLKELGAEVVGYALDPYTKEDNFVRSGLTDRMSDIRGDVRDPEKLRNAFKKHKPEIVFHMAAQPLVRESYINPKDTFDINIGGTVNVFECCRETESVKVIINVTSDKCYENLETGQPYTEDDRMGGYDPYSASKGCSELVTSSYRRSFFNPNNFSEHGKAISSVRAGNVFGGGDWASDRIIPDSVRALERGKKILIRNPNSTRPWQFVLEPLSGYLFLAAKMINNPLKYSDAWNFGPEADSILSVKVLVTLLIKLWGRGEWHSDNYNEYLHESKLLSLDISKVKTVLNWTPAMNVEESLKMTIEWYKNYTKEDVHSLCVGQINKYMEIQEGQKTR